MEKKGQVTIFIIVAILIISIVVLFFALKGFFKKEKVASSEVVLIKNFVQGCIDEVTQEGVYYIGQKGGYYSPKFSTKNGETYYFLNNMNYFPSKERVELELAKYVDGKFFLCSENFVNFSGYEIEQGNFESKVKIFDDYVSLNVDYPLVIRKKGGVSRIKGFETEVPVRMGIVYKSVSDFIGQDQISEGICLNCLADSSTQYNLHANVFEKNQTVIFTFIDDFSKLNDKPFEWVFANKY